ncbi:MAG: cation:proton antiporter [Oscillospiraceae bacterium]|nr:cation:proton antiporter [Oscillospiraceae bacterium]
MELNTFVYLACVLLGGLLFGKIAKKFKLPNVTGYLVGGLLLGPSVLNLLPAQAIEGMAIVSDIALGFIAFSIGSEFKFSYFKRVGFTPIVIALLEALCAVFFVIAALVLVGSSLPYAIVLGAIAAATAPAATVMVIKQYKAKGPVTETLLSVVALDDAVALIAFGFAVTIAKVITSTEKVSLVMSVISPLIEVITSLAIGVALGMLLTFFLRFFKSRANRLTMAIAFTLLAVGISNLCNVSALLTCMAVGAAFINLSSQAPDVMRLCEGFTPPIFLMFFFLSGAELNLSVVPTIGLVGIVYIVVRVVGKMFGAWLGATVMKAPQSVCRYLGPALIPQAGVAIGLSFVAQSVVPEYAASIRAVVLCGTLIYELIGPAVAKATLKKAGEITEA